MKTARISAIFGLAATIVLLPAPAWACSIPAPEPLEEVLGTGEIDRGDVVGVHEQRHLVRFPNILNIFADRSASVVDRYWGAQPDLRVASHGPEGIPLLGFDDCGSSSKPAGFVSAHANTANDIQRTREGYPNLAVASGEYGGQLSDAEAARLNAYFGPATHVTVGPDDYVLAYLFVLWRPLLTVAFVGAIGYGISKRMRGFDPGHARIFDGPTVAAGVIGITALVVAVEGFGFLDWFGFTAALGGSAALASLFRSPWALLGVGYVLYFGLWRDVWREGLSGSDYRLQVAVGALVLGGGSLIWARKHWTRFPATLTVLSGTFFSVLGAAEVRGYRNMTKGIALGSIVTATVAFAVWWLVFRERRLSSGALAEPPDETAEVAPPQPSR